MRIFCTLLHEIWLSITKVMNHFPYMRCPITGSLSPWTQPGRPRDWPPWYNLVSDPSVNHRNKLYHLDTIYNVHIWYADETCKWHWLLNKLSVHCTWTNEIYILMQDFLRSFQINSLGMGRCLVINIVVISSFSSDLSRSVFLSRKCWLLITSAAYEYVFFFASD